MSKTAVSSGISGKCRNGPFEETFPQLFPFRICLYGRALPGKTSYSAKAS